MLVSRFVLGVGCGNRGVEKRVRGNGVGLIGAEFDAVW